MPRAATVIAMAVIVVDAIVDVAANAVNAVSDQQAQLPMPPRIPRAHVKQNPVKKAAVVIAMAAPSVQK
jgi:hypothetical protein